MINAAVLTISDKSSKGERGDSSGDYIVTALRKLGITVAKYEVIPDDLDTIAGMLRQWADMGDTDLIFTTGGTGLAPRDVTPEATCMVIEKEVPGIADMMRSSGFKNTPTAILSRALAGMRGRCLIINLPGNPRAVREYLELIMPIIPHAIDTLHGKIDDHK
ncbi:MAG: MogA/MoaB family molybdenum cofactor biosynthesis protein [Dehalococcoidia bacterium]|nr:MogA/MoaB family molybdenum cofactor biosynthesis protein [Dehalococcoidia bacterium]